MPSRPVNTKDKNAGNVWLTQAKPIIRFQTVPEVPPHDSWEVEPEMQPSNVTELDRHGYIVKPGIELCKMSQSALAASQDVVSQSAPAASQSEEFVPGVQWQSKIPENNWCLLPGAMQAFEQRHAPGFLFGQDFQVDPSALAQGQGPVLGQDFQVDRPALAQGPEIYIHRELDVAEIVARQKKDMAAAIHLAEGTAAQPNQGGSRQKLRVNGQCDAFTFTERQRYRGREWYSADDLNEGDW